MLFMDAPLKSFSKYGKKVLAQILMQMQRAIKKHTYQPYIVGILGLILLSDQALIG